MSGTINYEQKTLLVKALFSSKSLQEKKRLNYLLLSGFEKILAVELDQMPKSKAEPNNEGEVPFLFGKDCEMTFMVIFKHIFESNGTNIDTICSICCHIVNQILTQFTQSSQGTATDASLDVLDEVGDEQRANEKDNKKGKAMEKPDLEGRATVLVELIADIFERMVKNQILKESA